MKDVTALIKELRQYNIRLSLKGDNLEVEYAGGNPDSEILSRIRLNKRLLIQYLQKNSRSNTSLPIPSAGERDSYPLSSSQRRLWILSKFEKGNIAYNIPRVYLLEGLLDDAAFDHCFEQLIERHEI